ncbi:right-handed parallel beta-helix repeat-containing protein [Sorangium sp. So ce542]|uniref:right-handed parallel beta-helix repeat-containing protein n=1 Tax=Sorangium sp. So ce542 TaxID=3133316 RepID=UPI003F5E8C42
MRSFFGGVLVALSSIACSSSTGAPGGADGAGGGATASAGASGGGALLPGCLTPAPSEWPTAETTGVPPGTPPLTPIADTTHTEREGQVFDAVELSGRLYVDHPNVTIRRSRLVGDEHYAVYTTIEDARLTIEDCDITGGLLLTDHSVARRNHLHAGDGKGRDDGFIFGASHVVLEHNLIDGLLGGAGSHIDGIQVMAGQDIVICHNWIDPSAPPVDDGGVNAALFFGPDDGPISDVVVSHNRLLGGGSWYTLRLDCGGTIDVRGNRFDRDVLGTPVLNSGDPPTTWEDNAFDDGTPIPAP